MDCNQATAVRRKEEFVQLLPETAVPLAKEHTTAQRICGTVFRNELQSGTWETREGRVCVTVERKAAPTVQQPPFAYRVCETVDKNGPKSTTRGTGEGRVCVTVAEKVSHCGPGNKAFRPQAPAPTPHTRPSRHARTRNSRTRRARGTHMPDEFAEQCPEMEGNQAHAKLGRDASA